MKEEVENLSPSDKKLCQMLAGLEKVEAPKDFDFHLKARIAKSNPKAFQKSYARRFGYILPATGLAAVLTFAGLYGNFSGTNSGSTTINAGVSQPSVEIVLPEAQPTEQALINEPNTGSNTFAANIVLPQAQRTPSIPPQMAFESERKPQPRDVKGNLARPKEGSKDEAVKQAEDLKPRGLNDKNRVEIPESQLEEKDFQAQEMFKVLGIETSMDKGTLKIKSLSPNSSAARSGLKSDDVIESINGQKINNGKVRGKKIEVKKVSVRRGDETFEINLEAAPKP